MFKIESNDVTFIYSYSFDNDVFERKVVKKNNLLIPQVCVRDEKYKVSDFVRDLNSIEILPRRGNWQLVHVIDNFNSNQKKRLLIKFWFCPANGLMRMEYQGGRLSGLAGKSNERGIVSYVLNVSEREFIIALLEALRMSERFIFRKNWLSYHLGGEWG